jgi:hypothetical protein
VTPLREAASALRALLEREFLKNRLYDLDGKSADAHEVAGALSHMLGTTYAAIGGFSGGSDLSAFAGFFVADVDDDPDPDLALYYKKKSGTKIAAVASDGGAEAKKSVVDFLVKLLDKPGLWIEVSDALANVLLKKRGLETLDDEKTVRKALGGKDLTWHGKHPNGVPYGKGWYTRNIDGHDHTKVVVGRPS